MKRQFITLGIANVAESAIQLLTPIVLVRVLDEAGFGDYRLLWLTAGTLLAIVPFGIPGSLPYFLPRHDLPDQTVYVRQTLFYLAVVGALSVLALSPWNPFLPHSLRAVTGAEFMAPLFCGLWVFGSALDILFISERRIELQAGLILGLAMLRGGAVIAAAVLGGIQAVIGILAFVAAVKAALLIAFPTVRYGRQLWSGRGSRWLEQVRYAIPNGANAAAYLLRLQMDQWLVVLLFGSALYGVYSIGAVALALGTIIRATVNGVIFPQMSNAEARGDVAKLLHLNKHGNVMCALFVFPMLAYLFAGAGPIVRLVFTDAYVGAIPVLRMNVVAFLIAAMEMSTVMLALRQGPHLLWSSLISLPIGILAAYIGSRVWGMPGAAVGVIVGNLVAMLVVFARASRVLALPVAALQEWRTITRIGGAAIVAGLAAYAALGLVPPGLGHVVSILISGTVFCCVYLLSLAGLGLWGVVADAFTLPPDFLRQLGKRARQMTLF